MNKKENLDEEKQKNQEGKEANNKAAHAALKGAATYFGGAAGNAAYNLADKLGVTKPIEELAGKAIKNTPALNQASKMLNRSGALDTADKAIDMAGGKAGGATNVSNNLAKDGLSKETLAKDGLESANKAKIKNQAKANSSNSSNTNDTVVEKNKKGNWLLILLIIIILLPFIFLLISLVIVVVGFLAPGLGVINFFSGIIDVFNNDVALQKAEEKYYAHLKEAQSNAFRKYNVCIDVNLIHATLTVNKLGDITIAEGEEACTDLETCSDSSKDLITVSDYRKMEKYIDILANMQIKRKKYTLYKKECYLSSYGDRCSEEKDSSISEKVTEENINCADIGWLDSVTSSWGGIPFRDSTTPRLVASNDKETNIFNFLSRKANKEKNYEYYLYVPSATYEKNADGIEIRKCYENVPNDSYDFAELDIGDWTTMEEHIYFYNLLDYFVEDYYDNYLNKESGLAESESDRYEKGKELIDRIYDYYTLLGPNRECSQPSEYICRDDEGADYYGGGETSLQRNEFMDKIAPIAIEEMERTGVNASITIAQAAVESGNGASGLSSKYSNYYGMTAGKCAPNNTPSSSKGKVLAPGEGGNTCEGNAFWNGSVVAMCNSSGKDCQWYRVYDSFKNSTRDHSRLISESYGCTQSNYTEQLSCIANKGYASASNYEKTISSVINTYNLTQYDIGSFDGTIDPITDPQFTNAICNELGASYGDWANWKQYDPAWKSVPLGPSTVGSIGCAMTSVAIQIARSGVSTTLGANFNPGTFAQALTKAGGFDNRGNINWTTVSSIAPSFQWTGTRVHGSVSPGTVNSLINQGFYVILNVKNGRHWVAVDRVEGDKIYMFDPGSGGTEVGQTYGLSSVVGYTTYRKG